MKEKVTSGLNFNQSLNDGNDSKGFRGHDPECDDVPRPIDPPVNMDGDIRHVGRVMQELVPDVLLD